MHPLSFALNLDLYVMTAATPAPFTLDSAEQCMVSTAGIDRSYLWVRSVLALTWPSLLRSLLALLAAAFLINNPTAQ